MNWLKFFLRFLTFSMVHCSIADTLAIEQFNLPPGTLHNTNNGYGWFSPWQNQNDYTGLDGYVISNLNPMVYPGLSTMGNYCAGGYVYTSTGRYFNAVASFPQYLDGNGRIGQGTFYFSFLVRKELNNNSPVEVILSDANSASTRSPELIKMGYFGAVSNQNANRYWSLALDDQAEVVLSDTLIVIGQTYRIVVEIAFNTTTTVSMWVNPQVDQLPVTPDVVATSTTDLGFWNLVLNFEDNGTGHGSFDELIFSDDRDDIMLPVEYVSFFVESDLKSTTLYWTTATEILNDYFIVQKSKDALNWESIGRVEGSGTSKHRMDYTFKDDQTQPGLIYYRLVQKDYDGQEHFSKPIAKFIDYSDQDNLALCIQGGYLFASASVSIDQIQILSMNGGQVESFYPNQPLATIKYAQKPEGIYVVVVSTKNGLIKKKIYFD